MIIIKQINFNLFVGLDSTHLHSKLLNLMFFFENLIRSRLIF